MINTGMTSKNADELKAIIDAQAERLRVLGATIKDQERLLAIGHHLGLAYNTIPEHGDAQRLLNGEVPVLTADPAHSTVKPGAGEDDHVLIEGDNLTALTMLQATHKGKVNVIYIDPPYNTGNQDFVYNDKFVDPEDSYRHSKWLSFMRPRLVLARELLASDGVIFVSIDDHEQAYLRVLMDEVFGEQNFIGDCIRKTKSTTNDAGTGFNQQHEYLIAYARNIHNVHLRGRAKDASHYKNPDNDPKGPWISGDPSAKSGSQDSWFPVVNPYTGKEDYPPKGRFWAFSKNTIQRHIDNGTIVFKRNYKNAERGFIYKRHLCDLRSSYAVLNSLDTASNDYMNQVATKESLNIIGDLFTYPKSVGFIKYILSFMPKNAIVLDFFAGSGTTGQAVAELNKEDGGHRRTILVTNNYEQDGAENGIARGVTAVRMRRVLTGEDWADGKKHDPLPGNLRYYRIGFKSRVDDADVFTGAFTAPGDIAGVIALARGAHDAVSSESMAAAGPVLAAAVANGRAMVLTNGHGDRVLVYADAVAVMNGDDEYEAALAGFREWAGDKGTVYLASLDESDDDGVVYPLPYVRTVRRTVNGLERQGLLAREK